MNPEHVETISQSGVCFMKYVEAETAKLAEMSKTASPAKLGRDEKFP